MEGARPLLLVVDDQHGIRILIHELFTPEGIEVEGVRNGEEALAFIRRRRPDVVLLDLKMPGMDGMHLLQEMLAIDKTIKIIVMTAYGEAETFRQMEALGVVDHFTKPFDILALRAAVLDQLQWTPGQPWPPGPKHDANPPSQGNGHPFFHPK